MPCGPSGQVIGGGQQLTDAVEQYARQFVIEVLPNQLATEGLSENRQILDMWKSRVSLPRPLILW
jgi:hypothetical protein